MTDKKPNQDGPRLPIENQERTQTVAETDTPTSTSTPTVVQVQTVGIPLTPSIPRRQLGIIFDIDGTLVAEGRGRDIYAGLCIRPYTVEFIQWCLQRGHRVALWTAGHSSWAETVGRKLCQQVQGREVHKHCSGRTCRQTFEFLWGGEALRKDQYTCFSRTTRYHRKTERQPYDSSPNDGCQWCEFYSQECEECTCWQYTAECNCRLTKDLKRVWYSERPETDFFCKDNTLMVENTPQKCRYNYGNAIYVPSYRGGEIPTGGETLVFQALQQYIGQVLEPSEKSVRAIPKCTCAPPQTPHACFQQSWWPESSI